jgi:hypothetical protein
VLAPFVQSSLANTLVLGEVRLDQGQQRII